uniref:NB-ARC domain-containing protein n=2 Tax=Triticum urartu TaxID=4572 RepID=A0A8R7UT80_TRIUA
MLFFNRVFGSEDDCPPQFKDISAEILRMCGALPLAIITIASLLASRQARSNDEWESIRNSLGAKFVINPTLEEMRGILNLSYMHLPLHLRPCLLYLGMHPEDKNIRRGHLVAQWVAEGFVNNSHGSDLDDVAKSYFNELINRSFIQPAELSSFAAVEYCTVHDMMLDLITSKCAEDNFSVAYNCEDVARMHSYEHKVRRLSLKSSASYTTSVIVDTSMSQVRSLAQFGESNYTPPLSLFTYLRVLLYDFPYKDATVDLSPIDQLFQLRHVRVNAKECIIDLPAEIRGLVHLETLVINGRSAQNFPSDIVLLPRLSHLSLPDGTGLPQGVARIKSLRALSCPDMEKSSLEDIKGIGDELTGLRMLSFSGKMVAEEIVDALVSSIARLRDLKYLFVSANGWILKRVPNWIGDLHCLRSLTLS